ncbi:MAG: glycosyltransferase, partial [Cucumibacter sp.]
MAEPIGRDCLLFSTADWAAPYWTNKQHTARLLAGRGWRVLYVESPGLRMPRPGSSRDWSRLARRLASGLAGLFGHIPSPEPNIFVYSPLVVPGLALPRWLRAFNRWSLATPLRRFVRARRFDIPVVWTYHPFIFDALAGLSTGPLIYHCVDDLAAVPFVDAPAIETFERTLLERADAVFATSKPLAEKCRSLNPNTHFLPNVADARHFGGAFEPGPLHADLATIPAPRLGYH